MFEHTKKQENKLNPPDNRIMYLPVEAADKPEINQKILTLENYWSKGENNATINKEDSRQLINFYLELYDKKDDRGKEHIITSCLRICHTQGTAFDIIQQEQIRKITGINKSQLKAINEDLFGKKEIGIKNYDINSTNFETVKNECLVNLATRTVEGLRESTEIAKNYILQTRHVKTIINKTEDIWIYENGIYVDYGEIILKELCSEIYGKTYTESVVNEIINKVKASTYVLKEDFIDKTPKHRICLQNGVYDLLENKLYDYSPEEYHFNKINVYYNPDANCDKLIDFWNQILQNPEEDIVVMQELCGWMLYKDYSPERMVMMYGDGRNGKGKTITILQHFIGIKNYSNITLTQLDGKTNQYSSSVLLNKLANFGGDIADTDFKDTSVLKGLTGRDMIDAPRKYKDNIQFKNYAKMFFACNKPPRIYDDEEGFWNRWLWLRFPYTFLSKKDYEARNGHLNPYYKIRDENIVDGLITPEQMSGLFNWAVIGLNRLLKNSDFSQTLTTHEIKSEWKKRSDSFYSFCMDHVVAAPGRYIDKEELRRAYHLYVTKNGIRSSSDKNMSVNLSTLFGSSESRPSGDDGRQIYAFSNIRFRFERVGVSSKFSYSVLEDPAILEAKNKPCFKDMFVNTFMNSDGSVYKQMLIDAFGVDSVNYALSSGELVEVRPGLIMYGEN